MRGLAMYMGSVSLFEFFQWAFASLLCCKYLYSRWLRRFALTSPREIREVEGNGWMLSVGGSPVVCCCTSKSAQRGRGSNRAGLPYLNCKTDRKAGDKSGRFRAEFRRFFGGRGCLQKAAKRAKSG